MSRHRIALVGLGMAVAPHATSLLDLRGRVEVAAAFGPSRERRDASARRFPFPTCDSIEANRRRQHRRRDRADPAAGAQRA